MTSGWSLWKLGRVISTRLRDSMADGDVPTREQLHAELDGILDGEPAPAERIWRFFANASRGLVAQQLFDEALSTIEQFGYKAGVASDEVMEEKRQQALLLHLILAAQPLMPEGPAGLSLAVADDLLAMLQDDATPRLLRSKSQAIDSRLKRHARRQFVLGVIYRAAREGVSREAMRKHLVSGMESDAWKQWQKAVPPEERKEAKDAGRRSATWETPTEDDHLRRRYQVGYGKALAR